MLTELVQTANLFSLLHRIDTDLAKQQQQAGCPFCGGPLHYSPYQRKPRGGPADLPDQYLTRLSLCCGREECRRRTLPSSALFMGRRVYWGGVIVVILTLRQNSPQTTSKAMLMRLFDVSRQTINRWLSYFREEFPANQQWRLLRGRILSLEQSIELPGSLLNYFTEYSKNAEAGLVNCLDFLSSAWIYAK